MLVRDEGSPNNAQCSRLSKPMNKEGANDEQIKFPEYSILDKNFPYNRWNQKTSVRKIAGNHRNQAIIRLFGSGAVESCSMIIDHQLASSSALFYLSKICKISEKLSVISIIDFHQILHCSNI